VEVVRETTVVTGMINMLLVLKVPRQCPLVLLAKVGKSKKKIKLSRYTPWRHMGERRYSSYSFLS
jgi:hypothetical protein